MKIFKKRSKTLFIGLTPLIDVVFILFVFFLLSSSFAQWNTIKLSVVPSLNQENSTVKISTSKITLISSTSVLLDNTFRPFSDILKILQKRIENSPQHTVLIETVNDMNLQDFVTKLKQLQFVAGKNLILVKNLTTSRIHNE